MRHRLLKTLTGLVLVIAAGIATALSPTAAREPAATTPEMEQTEGGPGDEGAPSAYAEWFYRQRAYPAAEIPPRALARAVREARKLEVESSEAPSSPSALAWASIGPKPITFPVEEGCGYCATSDAGRVTALAVVGDGTVAYLGAAQGGVWKTSDAGAHWLPVFDDAIGAGATGFAIGSLAVDSSDPNIVYAGTGEPNLSIDSYFGGGIFKSADAGASWAKLGGSLFDTCYVADLEIRGGTILASAVRVGRWVRSCVGGVYRSTDGGASWTRTLTDDSDTDSPPIKPDGTPPIKTTGAFDTAPGVSGTWFATVFGDDPAHAGGNIFKSADEGVSWTRLTGGLPTTGNGRTEIATAPSDRNRIYAVTSSSEESTYGNRKGFYTSADGGASWTKLPDSPVFCEFSSSGGTGACNYRLSIAVNPSDPGMVYFGSVSAVRTADYGQTWVTQGLGHGDYNAFAFDTAGRLWIGNDGGVFRIDASDGSYFPTVETLNATLSITQFEWGIAGEADSDGPIYGGTQDDWTLKRKPDGSWALATCTDGGAVIWLPSEPNHSYAACYIDAIRQTTNDWATSQSAVADLQAKEEPGEFFNFHPPFVRDPSDAQRLYFASTRIWRTTDGASTWNPISPYFGTGAADASEAFQAIGVTTSTDVVYGGTNTGTLAVTKNAAASSPTWTETQTNGLPARTFTDIQTKPGDPATAYVTASGFDPSGGSGHVFKTTDYGAHWTNLSADLPNVPVNAIEIDWRTSPATLYVATDVGVFWSQNGGLSWNNTSSGLPSLMVVDVMLDTSADKLLAATHGRGMYRAPMLAPRTTRTVAVTTSGTGTGSVTSSPAGIDCGSTCVYDFDTGTAATLTATPASGSVFTGWSGDCSGTGTCALPMSADHTVTATFAVVRTLTISKVGTGGGMVTSSPSGLDCGATCSYDFADGTQVTLTASAAAGSTLTGWGGDCLGSATTCNVTMNQSRSITVIFDADTTLTVSKAGTGSGVVTSSPAGIDCGSTCAHAFAHGTSVTLTATAASGSSFAGWSGACLGTALCTLTMDADRSATATFTADATPPPSPQRCVVPAVKGKTLAKAKRLIRAADCSVATIKRVYSRKRKGRVIGQRPAPGTKLRLGGKVNLTVSKGKKPG